MDYIFNFLTIVIFQKVFSGSGKTSKQNIILRFDPSIEILVYYTVVDLL
jgi:hypothetical protein